MLCPLRLFSLGLAVLLAGCATASPPPREDAVRVQSFNLRLHVASDGEDAWPNRVEAAVAIIQQADLVGVQEALPGMLDDLDARLPGWRRVGVGRQADGGGEFSALFYRADRFEVESTDTFWLSETPAVPGSQSWDAALPRICTWAQLRDRQSGTVLVLANTHFDHMGLVARRESAQLLVDRLAEIAGDLPLVLTGDFNVTPETEPYRVLASRYRDAYSASQTPPTGPAGTWNGFGRDEPTRRIDFVFVSDGLAVRSFETLDGTVGDVLGTDDGRYPSDHFPVQATVAF